LRTGVAIAGKGRASLSGEHGQNPHIESRSDTDGPGPTTAPDGPVAADRRLLIVEDSPTMRRVMRRFLERTGYEILEAGDGEQALSVARGERPDVVLLDVQIPILDGYHVLAALQDDPELREVPGVLVTSHGEAEDVADGLRRGAHDYLRKPFEQPELVARVHAAMRTKAVRDELRARNAQLERLVSTDVLTGLFNRAATADTLRALVSRSERHGAPLSIVLLDVDDVGAINEQHGNAAGDAALRAVAARVRGQLREEDVAGRWSGDEILVVAPDTAAASVAPLADRLRAAVEAEPVTYAGTALAVSVSAAAVSWGTGEDGETLVRRAEQALLAAREPRRG
jgi:diguanylate cyclase (GGDEF)-like protein